MTPRVTRKNAPSARIARTAYGKVRLNLAADFEDRCAYSMQHRLNAGGRMEIDHFDPTKKNHAIQDYNNLFWSSKHCNLAKLDRWPGKSDRKRGIRFIDCCAERDYDLHIFEDPDTHEVVGVTRAGKYHVRNCDLNAQHLVVERARRAELTSILSAVPVTMKGWSLPPVLKALKDILQHTIPPIRYLAGPELDAHRARKRALAAFGQKQAQTIANMGVWGQIRPKLAPRCKTAASG